MTRACLAAVLLVAATAATSSAGTYLGLGVGTSANVAGQMTTFSGDGDRSGKLIIGQQFGRISIEGTATRYGLLNYGHTPFDATEAAAALKLSLPVGNNIELFGRAGLERTWLSGPQFDLAGNGFLVGAGLQYRLDLGIGAGAVFVDYNRTSTNFQASNKTTLQGSASIWSLGLIVSL